jgi:hypothetical protein
VIAVKAGFVSFSSTSCPNDFALAVQTVKTLVHARIIES